MVSALTYVFVHLPEDQAPAGLLTITDEPRNRFATFAYGCRYLERPGRLTVDSVASGSHRSMRLDWGKLVGGVRDLFSAVRRR